MRNVDKLIKNNKVSVLIITGILLLTFVLSECSSGAGKKDHTQVFLLDNIAKVDLVIEDVIEQSEIKKEGFVVILPGQSKKALKSAVVLQQKFYKQGIMGVHILSIDSKANLLKTDVITIENAKIICLPIGSNKSLDENSKFGISLLKAMKNGAFIVVNNKETEQVFANAIEP